MRALLPDRISPPNHHWPGRKECVGATIIPESFASQPITLRLKRFRRFGIARHDVVPDELSESLSMDVSS